MDEKELAKYAVIKSEKECNPDHGRIENRQYYLCTNLSWLENKDEWPGLKAVAMAREERTVNGKTSTDVRFFLTSLDNIELVKKSIRLHWGIENRQFRPMPYTISFIDCIFSSLYYNPSLARFERLAFTGEFI